MTEQMTKPAPMTVAPQVKAVPDTVTAAFDEFMEAFEAFRETNDQRLADIERKMGADVVTRDKLDRIDKTLDDNRRIMDDLALKRRAPRLAARTRFPTMPRSTRPLSRPISAAVRKARCAIWRPRLLPVRPGPMAASCCRVRRMARSVGA